MLYSLSILYKSKLPLIVLFNKIDTLDHQFAMTWMKDRDEFEEALKLEDKYLSSLSRSMSLVLDDYYMNVLSFGVSATTGKGFGDELLAKFEEARKEYNEIFLPEINNKMKQDVASKKEAVLASGEAGKDA